MATRFLLLTFLYLQFAFLAAQPGTVDLNFNPLDQGHGMGDGARHYVSAVCIQPDQKIIAAGMWYYNGGSGGIVRILPDGSADPGFTNMGVMPPVGLPAFGAPTVITLQEDGRILIGGPIGGYGGQLSRGLARMEPDGSVDPSFITTGVGMGNSILHPQVYCIAVDQSDRILVGGFFNTFNGTPRSGLVRLFPDGSIDPSLNVQTNGHVRSIVIEEDGSILIGGTFTIAGNVNLARIMPNGLLDENFVGGIGPSTGGINTLLRTSSGIFVGGAFTSINGEAHARLTFMGPTGNIDVGFNGGGIFDELVTQLIELSNGDILALGRVYDLNGDPHELLILDPSGVPVAYFDASEITQYMSMAVGSVAVDANDGCILGGLTSYSPTLIRVFPDGLHDDEFHYGAHTASAMIRDLRIQDDQLLIGGDLRWYGRERRDGLARSDLDGILQSSFIPPTLGMPTQRILPLNDGRLIAIIPNDAYPLLRINNDGSIDTSFDLGAGFEGYSNPPVSDIISLPDGGMIISGNFTSVDGVPRNRIAKIYENGELDLSFDPGTGFSGEECSAIGGGPMRLLLQPDGRILVSGSFCYFNGMPKESLARLHGDGSLDETFDVGTGTGLSNFPRSLHLHQGTKVLVSGAFHQFNGLPIKHLVRLNDDGSIDQTFTALADLPPLSALLVQPDQKIILAKRLESQNMIIRLNEDGSFDGSFAPLDVDNLYYQSPVVNAMTLSESGDLYIAGDFTSINGIGRNRIARISTDITTQVSDGRRSSSSIGLFPNPNSGSFTITLPSPWHDNILIEVIDMTGKVIHQEHRSPSSVCDLELDLSSGVYVLKAHLAHQQEMLRFVVY